jgi:hypothetical protein
MPNTVAEYRELHELAIEIADDSAPALLESNLVPVTEGDDTWYDLDSADADQKTELAGVLRYCEARGLVIRHPDKPNLIQTLEP